MGSDYGRLPLELQQWPRWCVAGPDKSPYIASGNSLRRVSVRELSALHTFQDACELSQRFQCPIGYVLGADDPFTCIDLDVKDTESRDKNGQPYQHNELTTVGDLQRFDLILQGFDTYTELSTSGKGAHLWVYGNIGAGSRRAGIEVYSQERFIICTGDAVQALRYSYDTNTGIVTPQIYGSTPHPILNNEALLDELVTALRAGGEAASGALLELPDEAEEYSDREIVEMLMSAANADKFNALCNGHWQDQGYPSQSEADLSLMSFFTFHSRNNEQCRRLFRMTQLGKREKAIKNDKYLDRTLNIIRNRQHNETVLEEESKERVQSYINQLQTAAIDHTGNAARQAIENAEVDESAIHSELDWPPGLLGAIAKYMYNSSMRPVKEVAIAGAVGLAAGICGKAFPINSDSGSNLYLTLIARSAVGKEAMYSGVNRLMQTVAGKFPPASNFISSTDYASGQALSKAVAANPSFCHLNSEWGRQLKRMSSEDGREGPMQKLRTVMTIMHSKSGPNNVASGMSYSDSDKDVDAVTGAAYSVIGETTPSAYYESLDSSMMEDGFLSRFITIEYTGERVPANRNRITEPDAALVDAVASVANEASVLLSRNQYREVQFAPDAKKLEEEFDVYCDDKVRSAGEDESKRQVWNRAHLNTWRLAANSAAINQPVKPMITIEDWNWALSIVKRHAAMAEKRNAEGDVGQGDQTRDRKIMSIIKDYLLKLPGHSYKVNKEMRKNAIIPKRYLQIRAGRLSLFNKHRMGASFALQITINNLIDSGAIIEMDKNDVIKQYGTNEKCYRILDPEQ